MSSSKKGSGQHKSTRKISNKSVAKRKARQQGEVKTSTIKYVRGPANNVFVYG